MEHTRSAVVDGTALVWSPLEAGLWVAKSGGEFAGMAEKNWAGFSVIDGMGRSVGQFATLGEAKESLLPQAQPTSR